jgi:hypothetical protein
MKAVKARDQANHCFSMPGGDSNRHGAFRSREYPRAEQTATTAKVRIYLFISSVPRPTI